MASAEGLPLIMMIIMLKSHLSAFIYSTSLEKEGLTWPVKWEDLKLVSCGDTACHQLEKLCPLSTRPCVVLFVAQSGHAGPSTRVMSGRMDHPTPKNHINQLVKSISCYSALNSAGRGGKHLDLGAGRH